MSFVPSPQQQGFFDWVEGGSGSCVLEAVAGAGKTTTLIHAVSKMKGQAFFGAYNKKIAEEIKEKLISSGADSKRVRPGTMHSAGFSNIRYRNPNIKVDDNKESKIWDKVVLSEHNEETRKVLEDTRSAVLQTVSMVKQRAIGVVCALDDYSKWVETVTHFGIDLSLPESVTVDELIEKSMRVLKESISQNSEVISFDDMIYAPLIDRARIYQLDWVLIDEAQDTNPARRELASRMLKRGGRLVAIGDRAQALYSFTGADVNSLDLIAGKFNCTRLPLTVSYRCPKKVVARARHFVDHIESHPSAPEGIVRSIDKSKLMEQNLQPEDAILCRFNKPLVDLALKLAANGVPCRIEGRDIGKGLVAMINKMKCQTISAMIPKLHQWSDREQKKLLAKNRRAMADALSDRVESIVSIATNLAEKNHNSTEELNTLINEMFGDSDNDNRKRLTLSSVHKSKGREWNRVFIYGPNEFMPAKNIKMEWEHQVEKFIQYVAVTRAKHELVDVYI